MRDSRTKHKNLTKLAIRLNEGTSRTKHKILTVLIIRLNEGTSRTKHKILVIMRGVSSMAF